jgi:hypothetical protein
MKEVDAPLNSAVKKTKAKNRNPERNPGKFFSNATPRPL